MRPQEFDRTMDFIKDTVKTYKAMVAADNAFVQDGGVLAQIKRAPIGVMLNLGPFNYVRATPRARPRDRRDWGIAAGAAPAPF